jgi:hypothetical protein
MAEFDFFLVFVLVLVPIQILLFCLSPSIRYSNKSSSFTVAASITPQKRKKPNADGDVPQTKNTVAVLNELRRNLIYKLESQHGPVHAPVFTMSVIVDGQTYIGRGRSKKIARIEAAAAALRNFIQFKDGATLVSTHFNFKF